jgi:hypothetical protein
LESWGDLLEFSVIESEFVVKIFEGSLDIVDCYAESFAVLDTTLVEFG